MVELRRGMRRALLFRAIATAAVAVGRTRVTTRRGRITTAAVVVPFHFCFFFFFLVVRTAVAATTGCGGCEIIREPTARRRQYQLLRGRLLLLLLAIVRRRRRLGRMVQGKIRIRIPPHRFGDLGCHCLFLLQNVVLGTTTNRSVADNSNIQQEIASISDRPILLYRNACNKPIVQPENRDLRKEGG